MTCIYTHTHIHTYTYHGLHSDTHISAVVVLLEVGARKRDARDGRRDARDGRRDDRDGRRDDRVGRRDDIQLPRRKISDQTCVFMCACRWMQAYVHTQEHVYPKFITHH